MFICCCLLSSLDNASETLQPTQTLWLQIRRRIGIRVRSA